MGELIDTPELAKRLHASPRTLEGWRSEGRGPRFRRIGRKALYDTDDVARWIRAQAEGGDAQSSNDDALSG